MKGLSLFNTFQEFVGPSPKALPLFSSQTLKVTFTVLLRSLFLKENNDNLKESFEPVKAFDFEGEPYSSQFIDYCLKGCFERKNPKTQDSRKEATSRPSDILGIFRTFKGEGFKEDIVDLITKRPTMGDKNGDDLHERCGFIRSDDQSFMSISMLLRRVLPRLAPDLSKFPLPFPPDLFGPSIFGWDPWKPRILRQYSSRFPLRPATT